MQKNVLDTNESSMAILGIEEQVSGWLLMVEVLKLLDRKYGY